MTKICTSCKREKSVSEFYTRPTSRDGYFYVCKKCCADEQRERRELDPAKAYTKSRETTLKQYGLTHTEFDRILEEQGNVCAICQEWPESTMQVDHCHTSGTVRGVLCHKCNKALGLLDDDPERIERAAEYVKRARATEMH